MIVNGPYVRSGDNLSDKLFSNHIDSTLAPVTIVHDPYVVKPRWPYSNTNILPSTHYLKSVCLQFNDIWLKCGQNVQYT